MMNVRIFSDVRTEPESLATSATQRRRRNPPELNEAGKNIKDAVSTLNKVLQKKEPQEDDCDRYGKILANKLRKLSEDERLLMMYEIDGLFIKKMRKHVPLPRNYVGQPPSRSSYSGVLPRPYYISSPDNVPVVHIPETSPPAITEPASQPSSQQIRILSNEILSHPHTDDIVNTAFYNAMSE